MDSISIFVLVYFGLGVIFCSRTAQYTFNDILFFAGLARAWLAAIAAVLFKAHMEEEQFLPDQEPVPEIHLDSPADPEPVYVLE